MRLCHAWLWCTAIVHAPVALFSNICTFTDKCFNRLYCIRQYTVRVTIFAFAFVINDAHAEMGFSTKPVQHNMHNVFCLFFGWIRTWYVLIVFSYVQFFYSLQAVFVAGDISSSCKQYIHKVISGFLLNVTCSIPNEEWHLACRYCRGFEGPSLTCDNWRKKTAVKRRCKTLLLCQCFDAGDISGRTSGL